MSRLKTTQTILFSDDTAGDDQIYERNSDQSEEITDALDTGNSRIMKVPISATVNLDLAGLTTVKFVHIETNKELSVSFNAGGEIKISPKLSTVAGVDLSGRLTLFTDSITSISLTNPSSTAGDDARVTVVLGGV